MEEAEGYSSISDARKEQEHEDLSPLSVLEPTFLSESCWSSECSGSSDGNTSPQHEILQFLIELLTFIYP